MINVVGLGKTGCLIADSLVELDSNYKPYKIGEELAKSKNTRAIPKQKTAERYEEKCPSLAYFFKQVRGESFFFVDGSELISAASLKVLSDMDNKKTTVFYIQPDYEHMGGDSERNERVVFHVLQEYARSGVFADIFLISKVKMEEALGNISPIDYDQTIATAVASSVNLINYFSKTKSIVGTDNTPKRHEKIKTIGLVSYKDSIEKAFFDLNIIVNKKYYYGMKEEELRTDNELLKKIREQVNQLSGDASSSYDVFPTDYEEPHVVCVLTTSVVQERK
jgi:hypothetical protein